MSAAAALLVVVAIAAALRLVWPAVDRSSLGPWHPAVAWLGLHALFLLTDKPEVYGLPATKDAVLPSRNNVKSYLGSLVTAVLGVAGAVFAFRQRGGKE